MQKKNEQSECVQPNITRAALLLTGFQEEKPTLVKDYCKFQIKLNLEIFRELLTSVFSSRS